MCQGGRQRDRPVGLWECPRTLFKFIDGRVKREIRRVGGGGGGTGAGRFNVGASVGARGGVMAAFRRRIR